MSDKGNDSHAFDEETLKQALNKSLETPVHSGQENFMQKLSGNGISWIAMTVILLAAAGFTASGWMANQKIAALEIEISNSEIRMNKLSIEANQMIHEKVQHAINSEQKNEALLMQQVTQIRANRKEIKALKQLVADMAAQNNANTAIMAKLPPAVSPESSTAAPAILKPEMAVAANKAVARKISQITEKVGTTEQATTTLEVAKPTPLKPDQGWNIVLISLKNEATAGRELAALLKRGHQAEKHTVTVHGETFYQLRTGWFDQEDDARAHLKKVISSLEYKDAWIRQIQ